MKKHILAFLLGTFLLLVFATTVSALPPDWAAQTGKGTGCIMADAEGNSWFVVEDCTWHEVIKPDKNGIRTWRYHDSGKLPVEAVLH